MELKYTEFEVFDQLSAKLPYICLNQHAIIMKKSLFLALLMFLSTAISYAQYDKKDIVASTELTYEIRNAVNSGYIPVQSLCCSDTTYYNATNYGQNTEAYLVFELGGHDNAVEVYNQLRTLIMQSTKDFKAEIKDAKGNEFILMAPEDEKRIGTYLILQKKGEEDWGIISKNHIRNMLTLL